MTLRGLGADRRGNVAVTFALTLVPLLGLISFGIDYGQGLFSKTQLATAADAAALIAITKAETDLLAGKSTTTATVDAEGAALSAFKANASGAYKLLNSTPKITVSRSGLSISASVNYSASPSTLVGSVLGSRHLTFTATSSASLTMPAYLSFYLLLDVSGSMGLPSTNTSGPNGETDGQTLLASINPDSKAEYPGGCTFACHFSGSEGYNLSRTRGLQGNGITNHAAVSYCPQPYASNGIQLRVDAVAYAVQQLLQYANQTATLTNQYSVGLYPFIAHMQAYRPLTTDLNAVSSAAANLTSLLDSGDGSGPLGSGGTHFENALTELNQAITNVGTGGSASSPQPFVFLVTDGAEDPQYQNNGSWWGGNHATTIDTSYCQTLKNRGITVSVLYVPYQPIQNPTSFANSEDFFANANIPNIPPTLKACASPGFFFAANTPADIDTAMQDMFKQAVKTARLTN
jgi:Flp pilus assembly protein TadG